MNRILFTLFLSLSIVVKLFAQTAVAPSAGDGTSGNPYQIATWENLYWITQDNSRLSKYPLALRISYLPTCHLLHFDNE